MEKYINEGTIIKNDTFKSCKELIICQICKCIMLEPVICVECQNYYCNKCIEDWKKKSSSCPNRCTSEFNKVIEKKNFITKMKFKCVKGCGEEIKFKDLEEHYKNNCNSNKKRMVKLKIEEIPKNKKDMKYLTCKKKQFDFYL